MNLFINSLKAFVLIAFLVWVFFEPKALFATPFLMVLFLVSSSARVFKDDQL